MSICLPYAGIQPIAKNSCLLRAGTNSPLDTLQAAVLLVKLRLFDGEHAAREHTQYAACLEARVGGNIRPQHIPAGYRSGWAHYTVRTPDAAHLATKLDAAGIPLKRYHHTLDWQPAFRHQVPDGGLPVTEQLAKEGLTLPMHPYITAAQVDRIGEVAGAPLDKKAGSVTLGW